MNDSSTITVNGSGTPVIALHSSMSSKSQWARLAEQLERNYQFIAVDLSGYGKSGFPADSSRFSLQAEASIVDETICKTIGSTTPFHLIGHSYGGGTALRLAQGQPHRVLTLSMYEPSMFCLLDGAGPERAEVQCVIDAVASHTHGDPRMATRVFIDYWNGAGSFDALPDNRKDAMVNRVHKVNLDFHALLSDPLKLDDCRSMTFPVYLVAGRGSPKPSRRIVDLLYASLPNAIRYDIDAGHMGPITHANEVSTLFTGFIEHHERQMRVSAVGF